MDSDGEEPPSKRRCYERSSTPIRELDPLQHPDLPPLREEEENGLDIVVEPIAPGSIAESGTKPTQEDTVCPDDDDNDQGPDNFGLSNEAMGKFSNCTSDNVWPICWYPLTYVFDFWKLALLQPFVLVYGRFVGMVIKVGVA